MVDTGLERAQIVHASILGVEGCYWLTCDYLRLKILYFMQEVGKEKRDRRGKYTKYYEGIILAYPYYGGGAAEINKGERFQGITGELLALLLR